MRVCFVAAPLTARSGVYRSAREIVEQARSLGLDWSLYVAVADSAKGERPSNDPSWIVEESLSPAGVAGIFTLARRFRDQPLVRDADIVVSLIPQSDMALGLTNYTWVAFLRGLPWPDKGEASAARILLWRVIESIAVRRARGVWATTTVLQRQVRSLGQVRLVPAGIKPLQRTWDGRGERRRVVWAARFDRDKNPGLFLNVLDGANVEGVMFGSGGLRAQVEIDAPANVEVIGWVDPARLWDGALAYLGTSSREAFGRAAVEAAMNGIPVILTSVFGAAELLYVDQDLRNRFILQGDDAEGWRAALRDLVRDEALRARVSDHLSTNASSLTIAGSVDRIETALREVVDR